MMGRTVMKIYSAAALAVMLAFSASATLTWSPPITVNSHDIVGAASATTGESGGQGAPTTVAQVAQNILDLAGSFSGYPQIANGQTFTDLTRYYRTATTDYSGSVSSSPYIKNDSGGTSVPAGWGYVIAKYDGTQAGYILFHLAGEAAILPTYSYSVWNVINGQGNPVPDSYAISGWTAFNPVPEPTTIIAGALLLLPFAVSTVRRFRKN